ncbi:HTTM domain-containing protein [Neolewinella persica]|uniref:HTTM domain-containing protein n=1 Tax=Neolewinella persica TaxID=70998 RepID=UPI00036FCCF2|nr:HTTM domain-containing protein [Neolewinella persica]
MPNELKSLFRPVDNGTLVFLRIALGLLGGGDILGNGIYFHWYLDDFSGYTFRFYGFEWVHPLPEPFFSLFFIGGFLLGIAVALGWRFRITAPLFALAFSYLFLLEKAHYLNHAYLFTWLVWLLALTPAWREFSLDVRRKPAEWSPTAPAWCVYLFPALMGIVYFFGGIAKMNHDWLMEAMPLHMWLKGRAQMPILGPIWALKSTAYIMAWGGMLLDFTAVFLLLHKRLRWVALALLIGFHATNHLIFNIGIFPYLSMVLTSMFFAPDWPKRFVKWIGRKWARTPVQGWLDGWQARVSGGLSNGELKTTIRGQGWQFKPANVRPILFGLVLVGGVMIFLPLRHWLFSSDVAWSEEGHRYSWRMMLRSKQGAGNYRLVDRATGAEETVTLIDSLTRVQYRKMSTHPDMILQYAHKLRDQRAAAGQDVAVCARFTARLNGGPRVPLIDPEVDLSQVAWQWWGAKEWVLGEGE